MAQSTKTSWRAARLAACAHHALLGCLVAHVLLLLGATPAQGQTQTWSLPRGYPALWQIVSIDRSGEPGFPYGREDVAGDGLDSFAADEADADLRSVYADADADRTWLRAYVAGENEPAPALSAFFFLDVDGQQGTGGPAHGDALAAALPDDPTRGGYERAVAVQGNGSLLGVWRWDETTRAWTEIADLETEAVRAERGSASDPLGIGSQSHGYLQVDLEHALSGLDATCAADLFVRLYYDAPNRSFVDDAPESFDCRPKGDAYGDPAVLRTGACGSDTECPADGRCERGVCLIAYDCGSDLDCRSGETCAGGTCGREVGGTCDTAASCDGLVCDDARCEACTQSGARACPEGLVCAPNGACLDPDRQGPAPGGAAPEVGKVQGGALSCAAGARSSPPIALSGLLPLALLLLRQRPRLRRTRREAADTSKETRP